VRIPAATLPVTRDLRLKLLAADGLDTVEVRSRRLRVR
jgi:hypothetical protein